MEKQRSSMGLLRAPLGHWIIAAILAAAVAWGVHAWLGYKAAQSVQTATLSWNAGAARQMDPDLANAAEPAVATAESILSDSVVAGLAQSASLPSPTLKTRVGEFRSRLELRQSSASLLQVQFRDANPERAVQATNAVARTLVAGPAAGASAPAAPAPAAVAPPPVKAPVPPVKTPAPTPVSDAKDSLAHALGALEAELSATQQKLDGLSSTTWERREHAGESSSYREARQQQLLTAQVSGALKELKDLRADPANGAEAQEPLRRIQEALLSVWPASRSARNLGRPANFMGFNAAGVDASRLRMERAEFADAIAVVRRQQAAVQRLEPVQAAEPPAPAPSASASAASAPVPSASSSEPTPAVTESEIPKLPAVEAFQLLRPAGTPAPAPLWPVVVAGLCIGTLYLGVVGSRYKQDEEEEEYADEGSEGSQRLITPAKPMRPAEFFASAEPRPPDIVLPRPEIETPDPPENIHDEKGSDVIDQELSSDPGETKRPFREEVIAESGEGDPWIDNMMKTLSETSIGRMFETPAAQDRAEDAEAEAEARRLSIRPDRLAG
jgi:hypothetical protein